MSGSSIYSASLRARLPATLFTANVLCLALITLAIFYWNTKSTPNSLPTRRTTTILNKTNLQLKTTSLGSNFTNSSLCPPEGLYDQEDPCLIRYVKQKLLIPPSGLPLKLPTKTTYNDPFYSGIKEKLDFIEKHFINKSRLSSNRGFFIDCGANDGEFISNTLGLETKHNWTGVLIEASPISFKKLVALNRNAWALNQGLCTTKHSDKIILHFYKGSMGKSEGLGGDSGVWRAPAHNSKVEVTCVPLYTVLLALNVTTVDFFSLDVQGIELDVLKTVPLDKIIFKMIALEHEMVRGFQNATISFMENNGYKFIGSVLDRLTQDSVFVHASEYTPDMVLKVKYHKTVKR